MVRDRQHALCPHLQGLRAGGRHRLRDGAGGLRVGRSGGDPTKCCPRWTHWWPDGTGCGSCSSMRPTTCSSGGSRARGAAIPRGAGWPTRSPRSDTCWSGLRDRADLVIDTGELNSNQLRSRLMEVFGGEEPGGHAHLHRVVRLQVRGARWMSTYVRLPVPAQSVLGRGATEPSGLEHRFGTSSWTGRRPPSSSTSWTSCSRCYPRLHPGGEVVPHGGHGLHRRPAPLGRRWPRSWPAASTAGIPTTVFHRDVER